MHDIEYSFVNWDCLILSGFSLFLVVPVINGLVYFLSYSRLECSLSLLN